MFIPVTTIYKDNKSTILLAENGKISSSRLTRHLDTRYFFVCDKIKKGEVKVAFCPTHDMLADYFIKSLQGSLFIRMQDKVLNLPSSTSTTVHRSFWEKRNYAKEDESKKITATKIKQMYMGIKQV